MVKAKQQITGEYSDGLAYLFPPHKMHIETGTTLISRMFLTPPVLTMSLQIANTRGQWLQYRELTALNCTNTNTFNFQSIYVPCRTRICNLFECCFCCFIIHDTDIQGSRLQDKLIPCRFWLVSASYIILILRHNVVWYHLTHQLKSELMHCRHVKI